jgi:hypothetical protein
MDNWIVVARDYTAVQIVSITTAVTATKINKT